MTGLTSSQIAEILQALDALCGNDAGAERRQAARSALRTPIEIVLWNNGAVGHSISVVLEDFSAGGIGIGHVEPLKAGEHFLVRLPMKGSTLGYVPCLVKRCTPRDDGSYRIGAAFGDILDRTKPPSAADPDHARVLRQALMA